MSSDKEITDKQRLLDLLVDGELSDGERRELLAWCEREPDGWRRCALAFLEAQDWASVLSSLGDASHEAAASERSAAEQAGSTRPPSPTISRPKISTSSKPFWNVRQWGTMLAMAASVVLAFTLGLWIRDAEKAGQIVPADLPGINVVGNGQLGGRASGLPGAARRGADGDDWSPVDNAAMPDDVRQALERLGHHVEQQRRLMPYRLDDGRRVVIPVDQVEVRPMEMRSFQ